MRVLPIAPSTTPDRVEGGIQKKALVDRPSTLSSARGEGSFVAKLFWSMISLCKGFFRWVCCIKKKEESTQTQKSTEVKLSPEQEEKWEHVESFIDMAKQEMREYLEREEYGNVEVFRFLHIVGEKDQPGWNRVFNKPVSWTATKSDWQPFGPADENRIKRDFQTAMGKEGFETPKFYLIQYVVQNEEGNDPVLVEMETKLDFAIPYEGGYEVTVVTRPLDSSRVPFGDSEVLRDHLYEHFSFGTED